MVSVELLPKGIDLQEDEESEKIKQIDRTVNDDLDDFQDKPNEKKLSRRLPKEEDGNQWFQGPIDNNNLSKLKKFLRDFNPTYLQQKSVTPAEIKMNKVAALHTNGCLTIFY